jgi:hypothetical protein
LVMGLNLITEGALDRRKRSVARAGFLTAVQLVELLVVGPGRPALHFDRSRRPLAGPLTIGKLKRHQWAG